MPLDVDQLVAQADIVVLTVPYQAQIATVQGLKDALQGKTMTKANCLRYFSVAQSIVCDVFP